MMGMLGGRLLIISGFLIFLSLMFQQEGIAFYAFIALAYIITIPYSLWMRNQDQIRQLAPLQFLIDLALVSGLVYFAGDSGHDFLILLYPLIILSAGIILPLRQTIQITILTITSYTLVIFLMSQNILIEYPPNSATHGLSSTVGAILLRISIFIVFGIASAYVSRRCDYISKKEKQFRELTLIIFKNVKTGLLLLDENNTILMANNRACILLNQDESRLIDQSLSFIHLKPSELENKDTDFRGASDYFRRSDGSIFPVSIEDAHISLPAEAIPQAKAKGDTLVVTRILNFTDLSSILRLQNQTRQIEQIKAASQIAKEMAHQIRTPLTGISGAIQLLQLNLTTIDPKDLEKEREEAYNQIIIESDRMDKTIQNFLNYADFSLQDMRELIQTDIEKELKKANTKKEAKINPDFNT